MSLDPRLHPVTPAVAAAYLEGQVEAERFVEPVSRRIALPVTDIRNDANAGSRTSQALFGEVFDVYEERAGWAWGQLKTDGYVGWVASTDLSMPHQHLASKIETTHRVSTLLTRATSGSIKQLGFGPLPMGAQLTAKPDALSVGASTAPFLDTEVGSIPAAHLSALGGATQDWVAKAELFLGAPYVWGGRSALGLDCSALVQLALQQANIPCLRDSDMQEAGLGEDVDRKDGLRRGDLVFWAGHVGIMLDADILLHANAFHMAVEKEPLAETEARVGSARAIKRL